MGDKCLPTNSKTVAMVPLPMKNSSESFKIFKSPLSAQPSLGCGKMLTEKLFEAVGISSECLSGFSMYKKLDLYRFILQMIEICGLKESHLDTPFEDDEISSQLLFKRSTMYERLGSGQIEWQTMSTFICVKIALHLFKLRGCDIDDLYLVVDDTIIRRNRSKRLEFSAMIHDHNDNRFYRGFSLLTVGLTDGKIFVPLTFRLLASQNTSKVFNYKPYKDDKSESSRIRNDATSNRFEVLYSMLEMLRDMGVSSSTLLMDSWFGHPSVIQRLNIMGFETITMLKASDTKFKRVFTGDNVTVKELSTELNDKLARGEITRSSSPVVVPVLVEGKGKTVKGKIIMSRNWAKDSAKKKPFIAIFSSRMDLETNETLLNYLFRWQIETNFKFMKSYLYLQDGCEATKFNVCNAHVALVFMRNAVIVGASTMFFNNAALSQVKEFFAKSLIYKTIAAESVLANNLAYELIAYIACIMPEKYVALMSDMLTAKRLELEKLCPHYLKMVRTMGLKINLLADCE